MPAPALAASDFELLFGALPTPCMVLGADGTVLALNQALAALLPNADELPGQPVDVLRAAARSTGAVLPATKECEAGLSQALAGTRQVLPPQVSESPVSPTSRYWQITLQPVLANDPTAPALRFVLVHLLDVSEQVRAAATSSNQQQLLTLTNDLPQLVWTANAEGLVNYANPAWYEYTGLSPIATYGRGWLAAVHPNDRSKAEQRWQQHRASGESLEDLYRLRQGSTGLFRWHLARTMAQRDADGQVLQWLSSLTDIHEQQVEARRQRRRQRQDRRLLGQLDQLPLYLVMMRGPRHEIGYVSGSARTFLPPDATGREAASLTPGPGAATLAAFDEVYRTGESRHLGPLPAVPREAPGGSLPCYIDVTALPLRAPDGSIDGVLMTGIDVTDRLSFEKQMAAVTAESQRLLEAKEARQRLILDQLPSYIATYEGPELRLSYLSPNHTELLGGPRAQVGQTLREAAPELAEQGLEALLRNVYETGQPYQAFEQPLEFEVPATGERQMRYLNFGYYPLNGEDGRTVGILAFAHDVTGQVLAHRQAEALQAEARAADQRLRHVTESLPNSTFINDEQGNILYLSPQWYAFTGLNPADDVRQLWPRPVHPDDLPRVQRQFGEALATGQPWRYELRLRRHDGQYRWFMSVGVPEPLADAQAAGRPRQWFGSNLEVQDLKEAQQQLEQKDQQLSQILSLMPVSVATLEGPDHRFTYYNAGYYALAGHRPCLGQPVAECLPEIVEQGFLDLLDGVYTTGQTHSGLETRILLADARAPDPTALQERYLTFTYQALRNESGAIAGVMIVAVDVTPQVRVRQQAEALQAEARWRDERLQALTRTVPVFIFSYSPTGQLTYLNPYFYEYTGLDPDGALEQVWASVHADDTAAAGVKIQQSMTEGIAWEALYRVRRADGEYRWCQTKVQPFLDAHGQVAGYSGATVEIHEQYELTRQLARREEEFRFLAESIPQLVWTVEADGQVSFVNQRWIDYTGQSLAQTQNQGWGEVIAPEERDEIVGRFAEKLAAGQPFGVENRMRQHSDGQYRWFLHRAMPLYNEQGELLRWFGTSTDVHEQHELQDRLRESEEQFRFLAESVPQILWTARPDGWVDYYNQHWFSYTGLDMEHSAGAGRELILHPDDLPIYFENWNESIRTGKRYHVEYRFRRHDGQYRWYQGRAEAMRDSAGNIVKWIGTCTDIDDFKLAQQRLEEQNAALVRTNQDLDNFVYTASHDLKQPINNMAGIFEELTRTAYFRDPEAIKLITYFERALKQIYGTIEDLSSIVQAQRLQDEVAPDAVALAPLTTEIINSVHDQVKQLHATFEFDFDTFPSVRFVRPNLQSVLFNLISNSLKYAAPDRPPHIRLACRPDAVTGRPIITVQDNGLGIDMERYGAQLFQLFRRFHTHVNGSGMGLYLVNRIVQNHGGRLEVASAVGEGTTFRLYL